MSSIKRFGLVLCVVAGLGPSIGAQAEGKVDFTFAGQGVTMAELVLWWGVATGSEIAAPARRHEASRRVRFVGSVSIEGDHVGWFFQSVAARMGLLVVSEGEGAKATRRLVARWDGSVDVPLIEEVRVEELRRRPAELLRLRLPGDRVRLSEVQRLMSSMLCERGVEIAAAAAEGTLVEITARGGTLALLVEILAAVDGGTTEMKETPRAATLAAPRPQVPGLEAIPGNWKELLARSGRATGRRFAFARLPHAAPDAPPDVAPRPAATPGAERELGELLVASGHALLPTGPPEGDLYWVDEIRISRQILSSATFVTPRKLDRLAARPAEPFVTVVHLEDADPAAAVRALSEKLDQITAGRAFAFGSRRAVAVFALGHRMPAVAAVLASL